MLKVDTDSSGVMKKSVKKLNSDGEALVPDRWEVSSSDLVLEEKLGEGCFGEVYKGVVRKPGNSSPQIPESLKKFKGIKVAIKFLKGK